MKPDTYDEVIAQRDAARAEVKRLRKELEAACFVRAKIEDAPLAQARAEVARLRDARADDVALVARLSHQVVALRDAITCVLDGPYYIDRDYQDVLLAALKGEGR